MKRFGTRRHRPLVLVGVALVGLVSACGSGEADATTARAAFDRAIGALAAGDLPGLQAVLTERGRRGLEEDLRSLQESLRDPALGARVLGVLRPVDSEADRQLVVRARGGSMEDVWRFLVAFDPRESVPPSARPRQSSDGRQVEFLYRHPKGDLRFVRVRRHGDGWAVDDLQL